MPEVTLNKLIQDEIARLVKDKTIDASTLEEFARFVIATYKIKRLNLTQLKKAIYDRFNVTNAKELKKSNEFQMMTSSMGKLNLSKTSDCEKIYRKAIGILPGEENEKGYGCINGINIFKYDFPWLAFGLDPQKSTDEDVKSVYRELSKVYHPDNPQTGDAQIFDRLTTFYKSLTYKF